MKPFRLLLLLISFLFSFAAASNLKIISTDKLELRTEQGEDLVILTGSPVVLERDGETLQANRVIFNRTQKKLLLLGKVHYLDKSGQEIETETLEIDTSNESFEAIEVKINSGGFYLTGPTCQRVAGQILLERGYFTPCEKCNQDVNDYAFKAEEVLLYPGDRIIARGVWVLIGDKPTFYLPVLLMYLQDRHPKVDGGFSSTDGFVAKVDLPYANDFGFGYSLIRYFEKRGLGIGFDHYGTNDATERYQFLYLPRPAGSQLGKNDPQEDGTIFYNLSYLREFDDWKVSGNVTRNDGITNTEEPGFLLAGSPDLTNYKFQIQSKPKPSEEPLYTFRLEGYLNHNPYRFEQIPKTTQYLPELEVSFPNGYKIGSEFSISGRGVLGFYNSPSNALNRSSRSDPVAKEARLLAEINASYNPNPFWTGFSLSVFNRYTGRIYTSQNPNGELERFVGTETTVTVGQKIEDFTYRFSLNRRINEGETPFQMDFIRPSRNITGSGGFTYSPDGTFSLSGTINRDFEKGEWTPNGNFKIAYRPESWLSLESTAGRDFEADRWTTLSSNFRFSPARVVIVGDYTSHIQLQLGQKWNLSGNYSASPWNISAKTGYRFTDVNEIETRPFNEIKHINKFDDFSASATYYQGNFNSSLSLTRDLNTGEPKSSVFSFTQQNAGDSLLFKIDWQHKYFGMDDLWVVPTVPFRGNNFNITAQRIWQETSLEFNSTLTDYTVYPRINPVEGTGQFSLTLRNTPAGFLTWSATKDYAQNGIWINNFLTANAKIETPETTFTVDARYHLPEFSDPLYYWQRFNFTGSFQVSPLPSTMDDLPGLGVQGVVTINRVAGVSPESPFYTVDLVDFGPTFSILGEENTRASLSVWFSASGRKISSGTEPALEPKIIFIMDRCCWSFKTVLDPVKDSLSFSFALGGQSADFIFDNRGIQWPWDGVGELP